MKNLWILNWLLGLLVTTSGTTLALSKQLGLWGIVLAIVMGAADAVFIARPTKIIKVLWHLLLAVNLAILIGWVVNELPSGAKIYLGIWAFTAFFVLRSMTINWVIEDLAHKPATEKPSNPSISTL